MALPERWGGSRPPTIPVTLVRGQDLMFTIQPPQGATFPSGSTIKMVVYSDETASADILATWSAIVSAQAAEVVRQSEETDLIPDGAYTRVFYAAPDTPTADYCLSVGAVTRY